MRIAISGTHCIGKSTLIDEFLRVYPEFVHEPEPYTVLVEDYGEEFSQEPRVEDFHRQLEFNVERLKLHKSEARVIYERCPIDFLAYIAVLDPKYTETVLDHVLDGLKHVDLIVYLPLNDDGDNIDAEAEPNRRQVAALQGGDPFPKLRKAVDRRLSAIYREDAFGITSSCDVVVEEATGSTDQRLRTIKTILRRNLT